MTAFACPRLRAIHDDRGIRRRAARRVDDGIAAALEERRMAPDAGPALLDAGWHELEQSRRRIDENMAIAVGTANKGAAARIQQIEEALTASEKHLALLLGRAMQKIAVLDLLALGVVARGEESTSAGRDLRSVD